MYSLLISRARKSLRKPTLALWGCKALCRAVQIFLQQYLFMIGHGWWWWAFLSLQKRQCVWATSQRAGQWILYKLLVQGYYNLWEVHAVKLRCATQHIFFPALFLLPYYSFSSIKTVMPYKHHSEEVGFKSHCHSCKYTVIMLIDSKFVLS